jgi:hypothetical protein
VAAAVHLLSALISLACAGLLLRTFASARSSLLFWAGLCFLGLTLNNFLLFVDEVVEGTDLSGWRTLPALAGMLVLVFGLVWEETEA